MAKKSKDEKYESGGIAFVGFLMIGIAAGILTGQVAVGVLAGLGLGFVAMAILSHNK
jgi:hypothetical protein